MAADWPDSPIDRRTAAASRTTSCPSTRAPSPPRVRAQQSGQDAHGGRLTRAVRAEYTVHRRPRHREVDTAQRVYLPERLGQALHENRRPRTELCHHVLLCRPSPITVRATNLPEPGGTGERKTAPGRSRQARATGEAETNATGRIVPLPAVTAPRPA